MCTYFAAQHNNRTNLGKYEVDSGYIYTNLIIYYPPVGSSPAYVSVSLSLCPYLCISFRSFASLFSDICAPPMNAQSKKGHYKYIYSFMYLLVVYLLVYLLVYLVVYLLIHIFPHLLIYLFIYFFDFLIFNLFYKFFKI